MVSPPTEIVLPSLPGCVLEVYRTQEDWLGARNSVIGASESASIFGVGYADESPMTVWARKRGILESKEDTELLECGRVLQPAIIELFRRRYLKAYPERTPNFNVTPLGEYTLCKSVKHPWLGASLDDHFFDSEGLAIVEAKNVSIFMSHGWDDEDPPLKFHIQGQQQMAVTGADRCFVVGLIGGNRLRFKEARRNQKFIDAMINTLGEFQELVDEGIEPSGKWIDGTEATKKALARMHPKDNGETTVLPLESADWHRALVDAKAARKEAETAVLLYGNHLQQAIGDNTFGLLPDGTRYSNKHQDKQIYCCEKCGHTKRCQPFPVLRHSKK